MENTILQYEISDWSQLTKCQSNNSPELKIKVCKYLQNDDIEGIKISVVHPIYGNLFVYTIHPTGYLITDIEDKDLDTVTTQIILNELRRYGFYVDFVEEAHLSSSQLNLLKTINELNYDKIRLCAVYDGQDSLNNTIYVTVFNVEAHPQWLNSGYSPSRKEWQDAIVQGTAFNVSNLTDSSSYRWDWLYNVVLDINDIIEVNEANNES